MAETAAKKPVPPKGIPGHPITLGNRVLDPVSGMHGITIIRRYLLSGTLQYAIQPQGDDGKMPESYFVDAYLLQFIDEGVAADVSPMEPTSIKLGEEAEAPYVGFKGIVDARVEYINGCVHFTLQPKVKPDKNGDLRLPEPVGFSQKLLKRISAGISQTAVAKAAMAPTTGGPSVRVGSLRQA